MTVLSTKKWRRYSEYRPSGVEWLGEVPGCWKIRKAKYCCDLNMGQSPTSEECNVDGEGLPFLQGCAEFGAISPNPRQYCDTARKVAAKGDILISVRAPVGALNIADQNYGIGRGLCSVRPRPDSIDAIFCWYLIHEIRNRLSFHATGSTYEAVAAEDVGNLQFVLPSLEEQRAIAAFLDHETERIDALIAKKERQIELLQEKRTALISHAVTKDLNPDVKMKPSGVEWLGEVPEHWEVLSIKRITSMPITDGPHETPELLDDGIPFISAEAIKNDKIDFSKKRGFISAEEHARFSKKYKPRKGDIYMVKSGATTGNIAFVETDEEFNIWSPLAVIRPDKKEATTSYVFFFMKSRNFFQSIELAWSYGTQQNIGMNVIENLPIALPPLPEQCVIAAFLNRETGLIDALREKISASIEKLREFRTALISAAVTGKIDVREEVAT